VIAILIKGLSVLTTREKKQWTWLTALSLLISVADIASLALLVFIIHFYTQPIDAVSVLPGFMGEPLAKELFNAITHHIVLCCF
jgi:phosphoglycerol transferase MdoB-like AlkP superfamily enzyme